MAWLSRLLAARDGSIAFLGALSLAGVIGMSGMAVEVGQGYAQKITNQRVADTAALAAGLAYSKGASLAAATQVAKDVVTATVVATGSTVTVTPDSPTTPTQLQVAVTTPVPIALLKVVNSGSSYTIHNSAAVSLTQTASSSPGCVVALSASVANGISETGSTAISASGCAIKTNAGTSLQSSSTTLAATEVDMAKTLTGQTGWITTSPTSGNVKQNLTTPAVDYAKDNSALKAALCQVNKLKGQSDGDYGDGNTGCTSLLAKPAALTASGAANWSLGYNKKTATGVDQYQTADYSCKYVVPAGSYTIGTLSLGSGGCSISFTGSAASVLKIDAITGSGAVTIGDGAVTVVGTLTSSGGGNWFTIGNGAHSFGGISVSSGGHVAVGSGNLSVVGNLALNGGGNGVGFALAAGQTVAIGGTVTVSGGDVLCFTALSGGNPGTCAAPSAQLAAFSINGAVTSGGSAGGSTITFPNVLTGSGGPTGSAHVINGSLALWGTATLGSGLYVIAGNFTNGTGGTIAGTDITLALGGYFQFGGGTALNLRAPAASSSYGVPELLVATKYAGTASQTLLGQGSTGSYAGLIYAPKSDLTMSGGAQMSSGGSCLMMIVNTIALSGGTAASTVCATYKGTTTSGTLALIG